MSQNFRINRINKKSISYKFMSLWKIIVLVNVLCFHAYIERRNLIEKNLYRKKMEESNILKIFEENYNATTEDQFNASLNNSNISLLNSTFMNHDIVHKEYIFDRKEVRIIFIILYSIVFCCCFFGEWEWNEISELHNRKIEVC